ncbi:hypothetical protein GQ464_018535 [Rhodocaloribacter litoris]|uniref:TonB-dependent receptor n=1 Tax=Rhodocaloribacter litoris TaxID=2558931 RepID=UPI001423AD1D|nr:TonB-dependent receptor [Rhodocaloribacter litoris]QXD15361.1 hypothetical protein GQ464_018535 [Rhodocaloribacter litoris]
MGLLLLFTAVPAQAQQHQDDPALPDLAPREVEIRGQLEIVFPSLQRQPLIGFNPPPRVPDLPAGRRPYIEPYKQDSADLPPGPLQRPDPPRADLLAGKPPLRGVFEAGAGRYLSRSFRGRLGLPVSETALFTGRLDYEGADGFEPFDTRPGLKTPFDALEAELDLHTASAVLATGLTFDAFFDRYTLYGTERPVRSVYAENPEREGRGGGLGVWLQTRAAADIALDARLRYGSTRFETSVLTDQATDTGLFSRRERRLDLDATGTVPFPTGDLDLTARLSTAGLDTDALPGNTVQTYEAGAAFRFLYGNAYHVRLGLTVLGFRALGQTPGGGNRTAGYLSPDVRIDLYPGPGLNVYLQHRPTMQVHTLAELYRLSPYLVDEPRLQPTLRTVNAEAGVHYFVGRLHLTGRAGYVQAPNFLYFRNAGGTGTAIYDRGLTTAEYGDARILHLGGEAAFSLTGGLHASAGVTLQDGHLPDEEADIPYFPALTAHTMLSLAFASGKGLLQLRGTLESPRYRDFDRTPENRVDTFFDLDAGASYRFSPWVGAGLQVDNLLGGRRERWDNYPQMPGVVRGTLFILF